MKREERKKKKKYHAEAQRRSGFINFFIRVHSCNSVILFLVFSFFIFNFSFVMAQDFGFGFGFDEDEDATSSSSPVSVSFNGEITLEFPFYFEDYEFDFWDMISGRINFNVSSPHIDFISSFNINESSISEFWDNDSNLGKSNHTPLIIDEAYLRAYLGHVNIEAGYRKLHWGRADSGGPLDVTNPIDFSDLRYITDIRARKIARPMLRITLNTGSFTRLETVFIPNFTPHRFAQDGRWVPSQFSSITALVADEIQTPLMPYVSALPFPEQLIFLNMFNEMSENFSPQFPDTSSIENFQTGLRFTTTIGSADIGVQYFYGNLFRPNFTANGINNFTDDLIVGIFGDFPPNININHQPNLDLINPQLKYTRYHQFGIDYAQVLFGFNIRAEFAFNLTEDFDGTDGSLQNPFLAWSFGFDRDLFWGINLNIQCNETIRLFDNKAGSNPIFDSEAGTDVTNTRLTAMLTKSFLRDNLETKATFIWDIETAGFYFIPQINYTHNNFIFNVTAGFFGGDRESELGQYRDNNFIRLGVTYKF